MCDGTIPRRFTPNTGWPSMGAKGGRESCRRLPMGSGTSAHAGDGTAHIHPTPNNQRNNLTPTQQPTFTQTQAHRHHHTTYTPAHTHHPIHHTIHRTPRPSPPTPSPPPSPSSTPTLRPSTGARTRPLPDNTLTHNVDYPQTPRSRNERAPKRRTVTRKRATRPRLRTNAA